MVERRPRSGMSGKVGDPDGRRLARYRAQLLAEAARVARVLVVLAERAGFEASNIREVERELVRAEQNNLVRGHGRLEPRTRYKQRSGQPLFEDRDVSC